MAGIPLFDAAALKPHDLVRAGGQFYFRLPNRGAAASVGDGQPGQPRDSAAVPDFSDDPGTAQLGLCQCHDGDLGAAAVGVHDCQLYAIRAAAAGRSGINERSYGARTFPK